MKAPATWFSQRGAAIALRWLAGLDLSAVREHCVGLANTTLTGLGLDPGDSAIISLGIDAEDGQRLLRAGAAISTRAGRIRLSFHLYNTMEDVELVLSALRQNLPAQ